MDKSVITVVGKDKIGIIASVCNELANNDVNILDISQSILAEYFNMIMIVDMTNCKISHKGLQVKLDEVGEKLGVQIKLQREEIFNLMHRV